MPAAKLQLVESSPPDTRKSTARTKKPASATKKPAASATAAKKASSRSTKKPAIRPKTASQAKTKQEAGRKRAPRISKSEARVSEVMSSAPACCRAEDSLNTAAQLMWERDVGALVVVNDSHEPISMITDRDLCMAAYTQGVPLAFGQVGSAMSGHIATCSSEDSLEQVRNSMMAHQLRRLPVVGPGGKLIGIVGWGDLVRGAQTDSPVGTKRSMGSEVFQLMSAVLAPSDAPTGVERRVG